MSENLEMKYKLYKKRWFMMALFTIYGINGGAQWLQFAIINDRVKQYYNGIKDVDISAWTTTGPMWGYTIFGFPSLYLLDKAGVRNMIIIAATGFTIGTWIKVFSVHPDWFYLALAGQLLQGVFQVLTFSLSARFTAIWFGAHEISTAGAFGLFGDQVGTAVSSIISPTLVKNGTTEEIGNGLRKMHWYHAGISTSVVLLMVLFFKSAPESPPSAAQAKQQQSKRENVYRSVISILKKRSFILICLSYGLCLGLFGAIQAHISTIITKNFQIDDIPSHAGRIGSLITVSGMFSSLFYGKIVDKTRKFKESSVLLTIGATIAFTAFTCALKSSNMSYVYITSFFIGAFLQSYYGTGFQMAIEVTFPVSEEISSTTLFVIGQFLTLVMIFLYGYAIEEYGDLSSNLAVIILLSISTLFAYLVPSDLKRQEVETAAREKISEKQDLTSNRNLNDEFE